MSADKAKGRGSSLLDPLCNKCATHNDLWLKEPEFIRTVLYVARDQKRITAHDGLLSSRLRASACECTIRKTIFGRIITAMMTGPVILYTCIDYIHGLIHCRITAYLTF
jgi:hypothetical protein